MNVTGIIGEPGTGKTTFLNNLLDAHDNGKTPFYLCPPWDGIRGTSVGTVADFLERDDLPTRARFDSPVGEVAELALSHGNVTLIVDEAQRWAPKSLTLHPTAPLSVLCHEGRHRNVALIWANQTPWIHDTLRTMTHNWIFFRSTSPTTLNWITQQYGKDFSETVRLHRGYDPIFFNPTQGLRSIAQ